MSQALGPIHFREATGSHRREAHPPTGSCFLCRSLIGRTRETAIDNRRPAPVSPRVRPLGPGPKGGLWRPPEATGTRPVPSCPPQQATGPTKRQKTANPIFCFCCSRGVSTTRFGSQRSTHRPEEAGDDGNQHVATMQRRDNPSTQPTYKHNELLPNRQPTYKPQLFWTRSTY